MDLYNILSLEKALEQSLKCCQPLKPHVVIIARSIDQTSLQHERSKKKPLGVGGVKTLQAPEFPIDDFLFGS